MANGSRHATYLTPEITYGVAPVDVPVAETDNNWRAVRHTSCTLGLTKATFQSEEIRGDRQVADFRFGGMQVGGEIGTEVVFDQTFDIMLEAALCGTWGVGGELKAGVERRSFSVLREFADLPAGQKPYHVYTGVEFAGFKISATASAMVKASFPVIGRELATSNTVPANSTLVLPSTTSPMDAFTGVVKEGGTTIGVVTELELNLENGIEPRFVLGSKLTQRPSIKRSILTGKISAYFESAALLDKFINETASSLEFTLTAGLDSYKFLIPNLKYTGGQPDVSGDGPIVLSMPWQAVFHPGSNSQIVVTRS